MTITYNIYCDESCHLKNDKEPIMVLGAAWCPQEKARELSVGIRNIKKNHGLPSNFEVKWTKVSPGKQAFYLDLIDYFFENDDLHFRALIIPDKSRLRHRNYEQSHDTWYYKMFFTMLKVIPNPRDRYRIYLDIKDTRGAEKVAKLHDVLCNNMYDYERQIIERLQMVHSHEVELVQLTDLLIGTVAYANRELSGNSAKVALVRRMKERSGYSLTKTTLLKEDKVNIFVWQASEEQA